MDQEVTKQNPGQKVPLPNQVLQDLQKFKQNHRKPLSFFGGHPVSLTKTSENAIFNETVQINGKLQSPYLICEKTDGVRYLLIITNNGNYFVSRQGKSNLVAYLCKCEVSNKWAINRNGEFTEVVHILDGELIEDQIKNSNPKLKYLIFDCLAVYGTKVTNLPLKARLEKCQKFINANSFLLGHIGPDQEYPQGIEVILKDFFRMSCNTYASTQILHRFDSPPTTLEFMQKCYNLALPHENDGLIFNHEQKQYLLGLNQGYIKWKPAEMNTIDFLLVPNTKLGGIFQSRVLDLYLGWNDPEGHGNDYKMIFYNFTIVSESSFRELQSELEKKVNDLYDENPQRTSENNFGIIAECKYAKVQEGSEQAKMFRELLSSTKSKAEIHQYLMKNQNEGKEMEAIKKIQGEPCTKYWKIFRLRNDKNLPNNYEVAIRIQESIKDNIKYESLIKKNKQYFQKLKQKLQ